MNQTRTFLIFAWLLVAFLLWQAWQIDYSRPPTIERDSATAVPGSAQLSSPGGERAAELPTAPDANAAIDSSSGSTVPLPTDVERPTGALVTVTTDVLRLTFDTRGASVVRAELLNYPETTESGAPSVELFNQKPGQRFSAQSGWTAVSGASPNHLQLFSTEVGDRRLNGGEQRIEVPFRWTDESGLTLTRTYIIERGSYVLRMQETLSNASDSAWRGRAYRQLLREPPPAKPGGFTNPEAYSFVGAAWYTPGEKFNKIGFDDIADDPLNVSGSGGWIAMLQHYFFAAWIPVGDEVTRFSSAEVDGRYLVRSEAPLVEVASGADLSTDVRLYVGPKLQEELAGLAPGLERTIDYGILTILAEPLFWLLSFFHNITGNWGWAIILLVLLIKVVFFKLSETQYKSFAKMRAVQPRIESLKERYGDDKQKFNVAMMELYKKEKINPMGGCLPILVQIPVFISLYWVLLESVELRHAPWILWIQNLSAPDPYFVLPVLNLVTMWLTQKLSPAPGMDPMQKKMMQLMPLVFGVMFAFFPAGLVLYWTVNGGLGLLQQWVITRRHGVATPAKS